MPILELRIVQSSQDPTLVTLRPANRAPSGVRRELTVAGFEPGDRVVLLDQETYNLLITRSLSSHTDPPRAGGA